MYKITANLLLVLFGLAVGLAVSEGILRLVRPDFAAQANAPIAGDRFRIHRYVPDREYRSRHPDTGERLHHDTNNLGLLQHRDFAVDKERDVTRIGLFGDSFTANVGMSRPYSLSEPLDHLLNSTGRAFEVLNFGTNGYGTDQVLLQYQDQGAALYLDIVFYLYYRNDLRDNMADKLFRVSERDELVYLPARGSSVLVRALSGLHLTYFLLEKSHFFADLAHDVFYDEERMNDARNEVGNRSEFSAVKDWNGEPDPGPGVGDALQLLERLLLRLRDDVERGAGRFVLTLLPEREKWYPHYAAVAGMARRHGIDVLDLTAAFQDLMDGERTRTRFKNDGHWNEEGNKLAAIALFRRIAAMADMQAYANEDFIGESLGIYYASIGRDPVSDLYVDDSAPGADLRASISGKYADRPR